MALQNANTFQLFAINTSSGTKIPLAHSQTASIDITDGLIDVTTKDSNSWMEKLSGQKSFSVSVDGLLDYATTSGQTNGVALADYLIAGTELFFDIGVTATAGAIAAGDVVYRGSGFISSFAQSGGTDDAPTYSLTLDGNGALIKATIS